MPTQYGTFKQAQKVKGEAEAAQVELFELPHSLHVATM